VLTREGAYVRAPGDDAARAADTTAGVALLAAIADGGATPPDLRTLAAAAGIAERDATSLSAALEREGAIVRFGGDLAYPTARFAAAADVVRARCEAQGSITLADLRDALGTSRRVAQGLLERLDADGVTRRIGDARVLRRRAEARR
jgi:selenocysteine-specific elongation factor